MADQWFHKVFSVDSAEFQQVAIELAQFQYQNNPLYREYVNLLKIDITSIQSISQIPFLPIGLFKSKKVKTTDFIPEVIFESSGTTQSVNSQHLVRNANWYEHSFARGFEMFYGKITDWRVIGLLPSYLERKHSSLVYMVEWLIRQSRQVESGFYLYEHKKLFDVLCDLEQREQKVWLIGASFALLDFTEIYSPSLKNTVVVETGGMKGKRNELTRGDLHERLRQSFQVNDIHSEYGMTELLSQAYSKARGIFSCPPWMKVLIRDEEDPGTISFAPLIEDTNTANRTFVARGAINVIDLANVYSCAFIATDDAGILYSNGDFEVLGRLDYSDIRGCSLLTL